MVALNAQTKNMVLKAKLRRVVALTAKLKRDGGYKCQTENMTLKAKLRMNGGSEHQTEKRWWFRTPN